MLNEEEIRNAVEVIWHDKAEGVRYAAGMSLVHTIHALQTEKACLRRVMRKNGAVSLLALIAVVMAFASWTYVQQGRVVERTVYMPALGGPAELQTRVVGAEAAAYRYWLRLGECEAAESAQVIQENCTPDATLVSAATQCAVRLDAYQTAHPQAVLTLWAYETQIPPLQTRMADLDCILVDVLGVIVKAFPDATPCPSRTPTIETPEPTDTPTPVLQPTPRPSMTSEFLPTLTLTPTPDPWCRLCGDSTGSIYGTPRFNCPPGYWCQLCTGGRNRCVRALSDCPKCDATPMPVAMPGPERPSQRLLERGMWLEVRP